MIAWIMALAAGAGRRAAILGGLVLAVLAALAGARWRGKATEQKEQRIRDLEARVKTAKQLDEAPKVSSYEDARKRMKERDPDAP